MTLFEWFAVTYAEVTSPRHPGGHPLGSRQSVFFTSMSWDVLVTIVVSWLPFLN